MFFNYVRKEKNSISTVGWESKLGYLSAPKFIIQETNVGHFCKLSFVVIKKIESENTSSKHPICSGRKVKSSVTHSAFRRGTCCDHSPVFLMSIGNWELCCNVLL